MVSDKNGAISTFSAMPEYAFCINCSWQQEAAHSSQFLGDQVLCSLGLSKKPVYYG